MAMDSNGVADAEAAINAMLANGQTNIWDGLLKGLEVLASEEADASRNKAVMLLTDGQPNIRPPARGGGHDAAVHGGLGPDDHGEHLWFGYNLDSELLRGIATFGQGMYAFIPDGSTGLRTPRSSAQTARPPTGAFRSARSTSASHATSPSPSQ